MENPQLTYYPRVEDGEAFRPNQGLRPALLLSIALHVLAGASRQGKEVSVVLGKEGVSLFLFPGDRSSCLENPHKKSSDLITYLAKLQDGRPIYKNQLYSYTVAVNRLKRK